MFYYIAAAAITARLNISSEAALFSATCIGAEKPWTTFAHTLKPPNKVNDLIAASAAWALLNTNTFALPSAFAYGYDFAIAGFNAVSKSKSPSTLSLGLACFERYIASIITTF